MGIRIVRLGSARASDEGPRLGTVRRPPRGIRKSEYASKNFYDVWLPQLSPNPELVKTWRLAQTDAEIQACRRQFIREMNQAGPSQLLDLLATLSHSTAFSIGCYCEREDACHRFVLRELLVKRDAHVFASDE